MADGRHLENSKKMQYHRNGTTDFDEIWCSDATAPSKYQQQIKFTISKIQHGGGRHLEKLKDLNIFATD